MFKNDRKSVATLAPELSALSASVQAALSEALAAEMTCGLQAGLAHSGPPRYDSKSGVRLAFELSCVSPPKKVVMLRQFERGFV